MIGPELDDGFKQKLKDFNSSQGGTVEVAVHWDPKKNRWIVWVIPHGETAHPDYQAAKLRRLLQKMPDGREGVRLFTWERDGEYLPLDDRLFYSLKLADSFQDREHYKRTVEDPNLKAAAEKEAGLKDVVYGASSYYWGLDNLSVGTHANSGWRHRIR